METEREVTLSACLHYSAFILITAVFILLFNISWQHHIPYGINIYDIFWLDRMYGALTGLSKQMVAQRHGLDTLKKWRRGYANRPPPISSFSNIYPGEFLRHCSGIGTVLHFFNYCTTQLFLLPLLWPLICDNWGILTLSSTYSQEMTIGTFRMYWMYDIQSLSHSSAPSSMAGWSCTESSRRQKAWRYGTQTDSQTDRQTNSLWVWSWIHVTH